MNEARPRLFVAVELPQAVRDAIRGATAPLRRSLAGFRWSGAQNLHLTLAFIGDVEPGDVPPIERGVGGAVRPVEPFPTGLTGLGRFPERGRAKVVWVGLDDAEGRIAGLATTVTAGLAGFLEPDDRPFHPHITIARARHPGAVSPAMLDDPVPGVRFGVEAVTLFRSHLGAEAPRYERLGRWNLEAGAPEVP